MGYRRTGDVWTSVEETQLRQECEVGKSLQDMCKLHQRSAGSILTRIHKLNLKRNSGSAEEWEELLHRQQWVNQQEHTLRAEQYQLSLDRQRLQEERERLETERQMLVAPPIAPSTYVPCPLSPAHVDQEMVLTSDHEPLYDDSVIPTLVCVFDTETTGLPPKAKLTEIEKWAGARVVQLAYELYTEGGTLLEKKSWLIKPDGYRIPEEAIAVHHITNEEAEQHGVPISQVFAELRVLMPKIKTLVAHNIGFDDVMMQAEFIRYNDVFLLHQWKNIDKECTMMMGKRYTGSVKKLAVLAAECGLPVDTSGLHRADADTDICSRIYWHLREKYGGHKTFVLHRCTYDDKEVVKLLGGTWDWARRVWTIDESEPYVEYVKQWFM